MSRSRPIVGETITVDWTDNVFSTAAPASVITRTIARRRAVVVALDLCGSQSIRTLV